LAELVPPEPERAEMVGDAVLARAARALGLGVAEM
jgi:hypothetical protein